MTDTLTKEKVIDALKEVYDPEIPVNVVDLGLIYDVDLDDGDVAVNMTLTAAGCGMGPYIAQQAEWAISEIDGVEDVKVELVFDPPWSPDRITDDGKKLLGIDQFLLMTSEKQRSPQEEAKLNQIRAAFQKRKQIPYQLDR